MLWDPLLRVEVLKLASPFAKLRDPSAVPPSMNVTDPVGVVVGEVTVAVNFTACPVLEGFSEETMTVDEVAWSTTCVSAEDLLFRCAVSPS